jgi:phosphoribosylformylglycinamidine (FGAM) synthase-like enzyme
VAATNCLNFGNPEKPQIMWQFSQVIDGLAKACETLETPITGGNVSLYNETLGEGIYPTPVVGVVGILENVEDAMTFHFRNSGQEILLLSGGESGDVTDAETEIGSSEYAQEVLGDVWGFPPALDLKQEAALQKCLRELIAGHSIQSAHDCSDGGLAVTVTEAGFIKGIGAEVDLTSKGLFPAAVLFAEDASRLVITCDEKKIEDIKQVAVKWGIKAERIGRTAPENLVISIDGRRVVSASVSELKQEWEAALTGALHVETPEHLSPELGNRVISTSDHR